MSTIKPEDPLTAEAIRGYLRQVPGWRLTDDQSAIFRTVYFMDFQTAFEFMSEVASFSELIGHHPDWCNSWNRVDLTLTTHAAQGLTRADFDLASYVDRLLRGFASLSRTDDRACAGCR